MTKQEEIQILESLKGDTYFAQYFTSADIDQMIQNIGNDFGIELGCNFAKKAQILQAQLDKQKKEAEEEFKEFAKMVIRTEGGSMSNDLYENIEKRFGLNFIIKTKWEQGQSLEDYELEYMVSNLK